MLPLHTQYGSDAGTINTYSTLRPRYLHRISTFSHRKFHRIELRKRVLLGANPSPEETVVTVGEALYDCLADQLGKNKDEVESWTPYPGGAPANVATALARLGVHSLFLSAIGKDELGDNFITLLTDRNVNTSCIQRVDYPTRDVLVTRTLAGDREFAGFGSRTDSYADCFLDSAMIPMDVIRNCKCCVTGTLGLAYPKSHDAIMKVVEESKNNAESTLVIDVNWRPVFWSDLTKAQKTILDFVRNADLIKITDEEAEWLLGIPRKEALDCPEAILSEYPNAKGVLVSAGEYGSSYSFKNPQGETSVSGYVPILPVHIADTTGAGDAYLAGFIYFMLKSGGIDALARDSTLLHQAVVFATACGAATCMNPGAIASQPTLQEAQALLESF